MCSARKRSSYKADGSDDDDFDYTLQKRLRTDHRKNDRVRTNRKNQEENLKRTHKKPPSVKNDVKSNCDTTGAVTHSNESSTSIALDYIPLVDGDDNSLVSDNCNVSSSEIITDILDDYHDDSVCVAPHELQNVPVTPIPGSVEVTSPKKQQDLHQVERNVVISPKKQSSLLAFFKVEKNGVVLTKETVKACSNSTNNSTSKNTTSLKMYQSGSSQMVFKEQPSVAKNGSFYNKTNRNCPFYKKIPDTTITVDAFQYGDIPGCNAYFLSHFHSDHYNGLTKHFQNPIYCSSSTGNLVYKKLGVASGYIHRLPLNSPTTVANVKVTLFDANHCPGSVMFLFILSNGRAYLHTGDFRACQEMEKIPILNKIHIDHLYLDTTYCNSTYNFPSQDEVISFVAQKAREAINNNPKTLIVCGTYTIGKEKIFLAIADSLKSKVFVSKDKKIILDCLESKDISNVLSTEESNNKIHLLPMMKITFKGMNEYLKKYSHNFNSILGFKPTGWTCSGSICSLSAIKPQTSGQVTIYGVPYSEHSSFSELKRFVQFIRPTKVIPTVFGGTGQRISDMQAIFKEWLRK